MSYNRKFKDSVFRALFGREEYKENLLSLYNALNHTNYTDVNDLTLNTLDDVIYMSVKNDVSCIIDDNMSLYEHQSSYNPNMPIRGLIYFGRLYEKYFDQTNYNRFSSRLIDLPLPKYYVFYNGKEERPDREILKLSDAFHGGSDEIPALECTAVMLNINNGHNRGLMERCRVLSEYSIFVEKCRVYAKIYDKEEVARRSIRDCISEGILKDFLLAHGAEVIDMFLTEYNEEETMEMFKKEFYEDGMKDGRNDLIRSMISKTGDLELISNLTGLSVEEITTIKNEN